MSDHPRRRTTPLPRTGRSRKPKALRITMVLGSSSVHHAVIGADVTGFARVLNCDMRWRSQGGGKLEMRPQTKSISFSTLAGE